MSAHGTSRSCDLCLAPIEGQMTWVQYSPGAFVYGSTEIRVTPERSRLRDVYVCTECAASLRGRLATLIEQRGQPARAYRDAAGG